MLRGRLVQCRKLTSNDFEPFFLLLNSASTSQARIPDGYRTEASMTREFNKNGCWSDEQGLMIIEGGAMQMLGVLYYSRPASYFQGLEINFLLFKKRYQDKGYMQEAVQLFSDHLMCTRPINRLQLLANANADAVIAIAKAHGFVQEGLFREVVFYEGKFENLLVFSLLRNEWLESRKHLGEALDTCHATRDISGSLPYANQMESTALTAEQLHDQEHDRERS